MITPGDKILGLSLAHGGHLTHGMKLNFSGKLYNVAAYQVEEDTFRIDMDRLREQAIAEKPQVIIAGWSAYPRHLDFAAFRSIADEVGALLWTDMAHFAGLVAAGLHPTPVPHSDVVTSTVHKTLAGPRSGVILAKQEWAKKINSAVFPGQQGGPLMHVIAAKAVAFKVRGHRGVQGAPGTRAGGRQDHRRAPQRQADVAEAGVSVLTGGTDVHLVLVDLRNSAAGRPAGRGPAAQRGHHGQPQRRAVRPAPADGHLRPAHRHPGPGHPRLRRRLSSPRSRTSSPPR